MPSILHEAIIELFRNRPVLAAELLAEVAVAALAGSAGVEDTKRKTLYVDLVLFSLGEAARRAFEALMLKNYQYQSDFARKYFAEGRAEGVLEGELKPLVRQFERRLARSLTPTEHARLMTQVRAQGLERIGDLVLDLTPEALAAWLATPNGN